MNLENLANIFLIEKVYLYDPLFAYFLFFSFSHNDFVIDEAVNHLNNIYIKLSLGLEIGILKIQELTKKLKLKKTNAIYLNQIYNKNYLSKLKYVEEKTKNATKYFLVDQRINLKKSLYKYNCFILSSFPVVLKFKSKYFYPYIINYLNEKMLLYNNTFFDSKLFQSICIKCIETDIQDDHFFNDRINFISEDENLKIYEKINSYEEEVKKVKFLIFDFQSEINFLKKNFFEDGYLNYDIFYFTTYLNIQTTSNLPLFAQNNNGDIIAFDEKFKNIFELKLIEYFAFAIKLCKNRKDKKDENTEEIQNELANMSIDNANSSFKKTLLKPYNKEDILLQSNCEVDYGDKKINKKEENNRELYLKNMILNANKNLIQKVEGEIINGNLIEKEKKVAFCIPHNRNSILNKLN